MLLPIIVYSIQFFIKLKGQSRGSEIYRTAAVLYG